MTPVNIHNMLGKIVGMPDRLSRKELASMLRDAMAGYDVVVATERESSRNLAICELKGMDQMAVGWARTARKALQQRLDLRQEIDALVDELEGA